jgi:hypothetical protein
VWDRRVEGERHSGITAVVNVASRPRVQALTTGAGSRIP